MIEHVINKPEIRASQTKYLGYTLQKIHLAIFIFSEFEMKTIILNHRNFGTVTVTIG